MRQRSTYIQYNIQQELLQTYYRNFIFLSAADDVETLSRHSRTDTGRCLFCHLHKQRAIWLLATAIPTWGTGSLRLFSSLEPHYSPRDCAVLACRWDERVVETLNSENRRRSRPYGRTRRYVALSLGLNRGTATSCCFRRLDECDLAATMTL